MKLGIMQPYFFPYAQQFKHIGQCDLWIVFDTVNFKRKSWMSRNRIINKDKGFGYISVPVVKGSSYLAVKDAEISGNSWKGVLYNALRVYQHSAPFYEETLDVIQESLEKESHITVTDLNVNILKTINATLNIDTEIKRLSEMNIDLPVVCDAGEWALNIAKALGYSTYSNAPGGKEIFDEELYFSNGVRLEFYKPSDLIYSTGRFDFQADLSIIDSLMWMGISELSKWCHKN